MEQVLGCTLNAISSGRAEWDAHPAAWRQGYCPVCGSYPSIAFLDKKEENPNNAFLASGSGKKHLHCGLCGTEWHFRHGACLACGKEGPGTIEILRESGICNDERVDYCTSCKVYCPTVVCGNIPVGLIWTRKRWG